ncbi:MULTISPECIES: DUF461 domain-containing protein [Streptomyces]|uniref:DUF461 domain-containing protein n=1 Tax=Streptomyces lonegramiae TaxID=3075524 RepID=A0ABU2XDX4_9ACTN|nr:DUF461 domain-containing protein [Streptomyces sp. DSM 41529]MDT0544102.1 DUF461 domain-containing protein [Streptomyces sp. DSM 41529]
MSSSLRRGVLAAALVVPVASISACAAGNDAQTLEVKPDNAATSVGDIKIQNASIVTQPEREAKGPAVVTAKIFNNGGSDQTIKAITLPGTSSTVKVSPAKGTGPVVVPAGGAVLLGGKGNPSAVIANGREAARDGDAQRVVFDLSKTGDVPITAFVVPAQHYFEGWGPSQLPTATPTNTTPTTPAGKQSSKPGSTPSGTGTGTDKPSGEATNKPSGEAGESNAPSNGIASGEPAPNQ